MENPFDVIENKLLNIENKLDNLVSRIENPTEFLPKWMTVKQLSEYLGISTSVIHNLKISKIPSYKLGGRVFFKKEEIDEFIQKTRHGTEEEIYEEWQRRRQKKY